jgi:hypothetical protein
MRSNVRVYLCAPAVRLVRVRVAACLDNRRNHVTEVGGP